jgi:Calcineurin-like phosphoesterase
MKRIVFSFFPLLLVGFILRMETGHHDLLAKNDQPVQYDGPYVQYKNDEVFVKYIFENGGTKNVKADSMALLQKGSIVLQVNTDIPAITFPVRLKDQLQKENSEFVNVHKQLLLSDIEGNFAAIRMLLQANGVMDANFNWTFGDGHLVLIGDFFDRGQQVTEVLWLIYSLEAKAKAAGGYVHFILGNHEIMNLSGDLRYLQQKYFDNAALLNVRYETLYDENTELGRWLRTKNVIEKEGDVLVLHGGVSGEINRLNISVADINQLARPYYADSSYTYPDKKLDVIYGDTGPFWYRGYYKNAGKITPKQIDSTLTLWGVKHIVTGHTIVADTISVWYNGKLMNTDVHHAAGKSEALLIEDGKYYRVNPAGNKVLLLQD